MEDKINRANVFSNNFTKIRNNKNLSQLELSMALGTEELTIYSWEQGISEPSIDMLVKISELFNVSLDLLLNNVMLSERNVLNNDARIPYLRFLNDILIDVNCEFEYLLNYDKHELIGKTIYEVSTLLKIDSQINLKDIIRHKNAYIFTKDNYPREVIITEIEKSEDERVYYLEENIYSRLENSMAFIYNISFQDVMAISIYSFPDGILLMANEKFFNFFNIAYKDYALDLGKSVKEILKNCNDNAFGANILTALKTGDASFYKDISYKISEEHYLYWDSYIVPVYIKGEIKYFVHMAHNVTEKVTYKNIIERQNQTLEAIIGNISDDLIIFNKNKEFINVNKLARFRFPHDFRNNSKMDDGCNDIDVYDYSGGNIIYKENRLYNRVLNGEKIINEKYILKNNNVSKIKEISGIPLYDHNGNFLAGVLLFHDITEKLINEENQHIKAQYDTLTQIVNNLDLCFERYSYPSLDAIEINNKAFDLLKNFNSNTTSSSSIKGMKLNDIMHVKKSVLEKILNTIEKLDIYQDVCQYNINGNEIYYKYIYQPLYGLNNKIVEIIVIGLDITKDVKSKKKMEKVLKIQDEIYSNVSHELKTPISVIFSANQMLDIYLKNISTENNDKLLSYNNIIKQNCYRLIRLINNIIDISKSSSGNFKLNLSNENIVSIVKNIVESVTEFVNSKDLRIIFETNVNEKIIACDPLQIERIMLNLISNAIKFSNPKSVILVKVVDMVSNVEISVKDEGVGIEQEHLENIFQRYYQVNKSLNRNAEGSGIGLSLIKSIIELHGGKIYVKSKVNSGSTFTIELPSKVVDNESESIKRHTDGKVEMIKIEFSDIYSI